MIFRFQTLLAAAVLLVAATPTLLQAYPDSRPGVDAPALASLGPHPVGVRSLVMVEPNIPDLSRRPAAGPLPTQDRKLRVELWYPSGKSGGRPVTYRGAFASETPGQRAAFTIKGLAVRDAPLDQRGPYPLVIMSHGYSGAPEAMSWLAENLASKGYVVAAPYHDDPPITDGSQLAIPMLLRPLDIAFVAHTLLARTRSGDKGFAGLIDQDRVALAGYSMGGYGVLTVAGAGLSPTSAARVPGGALLAYARGGTKAQDLIIKGLKAVVAISPAGGEGALKAWDAEGLAELRTPTLLIVGDQDKLVGFNPGVKSVFDGALNAPRYMLVFRNGAHSIGMDSAPKEMQARLWDLDWFEDPVWRKARVLEINLHMITAFLDLWVKGDQSRAPYLDLIPSSNDGVWPAPQRGTAYAAPSPGASGTGSSAVTLWKGFQRTHNAGLEFYRLGPAPQP